MLALPRLTGPSHASLPAGPDVQLRAAGVDWDAVCTPGRLGERVLAALDEDSGSTFRDRYNHLWYWLIPRGAADHWRLPDEAHVRILGRGSWVGVPPAQDHYAAARWVRLLDDRRLTVTDAGHLHAALQVAISRAAQ